ncbi:PAS domain S-box protein [Litoribacter ruber]|uniref:PAS domain S-box protein n=1 Tax=Litoribacter ruber TaxID=702568 RepID=UPI001BD952D0|nr:PAS domain S-box protein [Litoribacter ruber]MBT0810299.1 PAS domain S-box protein [Litoribacter ruber]
MDQSLLQGIFDGAPTSYLIVEANKPIFTILDVNKSYLRDTNRDKEDLIGKGIFEAFPSLGDDNGPKNLENSLNKIIREKKAHEMPIVKYDVFNHRTGKIEEHYWEPINTPILNEQGEVECIIHQVKEVTDYVLLQIKNNSEKSQLEETKLKFESVFNFSSAGIAMLDLDGRWIEVNPKICEITGYSRKELFEMTFQDLTHPDDLKNDLEHVQMLLEDKIKHYKLEKRYLHKDGHVIWAWLSVTLVRKGNGKPYHFISHVLDITDKKENEKALLVSENRYESLFQHHPDAVFAFDLNGKFIEANQNAVAIAEGSLSKLLDSNFLVFLPDGEKQRVSDYFQRAKNGEQLNYNIDFTSFKNTKLRLNITNLPIYQGEEITGVYGIAKDITASEQAKTELKESRDRLEKVYSRSLDVICTIDREGNFQEVSQASHKIWGFSPEELTGRLYIDLVHPDDRDITLAAAQAIMQGQDVTAFQNRYLRKDGKVVPIIWSAHYDPEDQLMFCVARDGREKIEAEIILRKNEERFRKLVQDGSDLIAILDEEGNYAYVSPTSYSILEISPEELLGKSAFDYIHPEDVDNVYEHFGRLERERRISLPPFRFQNKHGQWRWMETQITNLLEDSTIKGIVANSRDITERIKAEIELQQTAEKYWTLFNSSPLPQWIYDLETLRFLDVNHATVEFYGYDQEEFLRMTLADIRPAEEIDKMMIAHQKNLGEKSTHKFGIFTHQKCNGELAKMEIYGYALTYQDLPAKMIIALDVTEREEALSRLYDRENKLVAAQKLAKIGYWQNNLEKQQIDWSDEVYEMFGVPLGTVITEQHHWAPIPEEERTTFRKVIQNCIANKDSYEFEHSIVLPDGSVKWIKEFGYYRPNLDGDWVLSGTVQDITKDRLAKELLIESESRYRAIIESHTSFVIRTDLEGQYTFCNEKYEETFAWIYSDGKILGKKAVDSIMPYHLEKMEETIEKCLTFSNEAFRVEIDKRTPDGNPMTTIWEFMALSDYGGNITEIQCVGIDITDRKKAEMELRTSNQRYELVTKATSDAVWDWDIEQNSIFRSAGFSEMFGFSEEQIQLGHDFWQSKVHPKDFHWLNESIYNFIHHFKDQNWITEYRFYNVKDEILYVRDRAIAVRDEKGKAIRLVGAIQNITAHKIKEKEDKLKLSLSQVFAQNASVEQIFHDSLGKLLEFTELDYGEIWIANLDNTRLNMVTYKGDLNTSPTKYKMSFKRDEGFPGMVYGSAEVVLLGNLEKQNSFVRHEFIQQNKFSCVIGYPIKFEKEIIGVICLFRHESNDPLNNHPKISESSLQLLALDFKRKKAELDLNLFFDLSPDLLCIANLQGYFKRVNASFTKLLGYDFEEIQDVNFLDIIHPEDVEKTKSALGNLDIGETIYNFENRYIKKDKTVIWLSWTATPLVGEEHVFAIARDVTERKKYELELEASKKQVTDTLESIQDGFFALNDDYIVTFWNSEAEKLLRRNKEKVIGTLLWDHFPEALELAFYKSYEEVKRTKKPIRFEEHFPPLQAWFGVSVFPAEEGLTVYFKDITKEKLAELELLKFKKVIENSQEAISIINIQPKSIYLNPTFEKNLQLNSKELEGFGEINLYENKQKGAAIFEKLFDGEFVKEEVDLLNQAGEILHYSLSAGPIYDDNGKLVAIYGIHADISERIKNENRLKELNRKLETHAKELARSNAELEQFAYVASHDLQEPLRMVTSFLNLLEKKYKEQLDDKGRKYIYFAVDGAKRMRQIILDLLEYSRVGRMEDKFEKVDMNGILEEIRSLHRQQIAETSAKILADSLPTLTIPKAPIRQVFHNLINNGLKYQAPGNRPVIKIQWKELADHFEFSIEDNGIGFNPEYREKVFVIFQRLHQREEYSGTGMGLAVTRKIIENLKGKIWVDSKEGIGSTFYFTIPKKAPKS